MDSREHETKQTAERRKHRDPYSEWKWECCYCGDAGMDSTSTGHCPNPECQHRRCKHCPVEAVKSSSRRERSCATQPTPLQTHTHQGYELETTEFLKVKRSGTSLPAKSSKTQRSRIRPRKTQTEDTNHLVPQALPSTEVETLPKTFACPYHKKDPAKYDPRISKKYKTCLAPRIPVLSLRRIKEHLQAAHGPLYCDRCFVSFSKGADLIKHYKDPRLCNSQVLKNDLSSISDGISSTQWRAIDGLTKEQGGLKGLDKERHEKDRWKDIFAVIFPGFPAPSSPWTEIPSQFASHATNSGSLFIMFQKITERKIKEGILCRDDRVHQTYLDILQEACHTHMEPAENTISFDTLIPTVLSASRELKLEYRDTDVFGTICADKSVAPQELETTRMDWTQSSPLDPLSPDRNTHLQSQGNHHSTGSVATSPTMHCTNYTLPMPHSPFQESDEKFTPHLPDHRYDYTSNLVSPSEDEVSDELAGFDFNLYCGVQEPASFETSTSELHHTSNFSTHRVVDLDVVDAHERDTSFGF